MECVFVTLMDVSYFFSFFIVLSGIRFIQYSVCFPILLPLTTASQCAQMNMLLTGIDRLFAVLLPVWFETVSFTFASTLFCRKNFSFFCRILKDVHYFWAIRWPKTQLIFLNQRYDSSTHELYRMILKLARSDFPIPSYLCSKPKMRIY